MTVNNPYLDGTTRVVDPFNVELKIPPSWRGPGKLDLVFSHTPKSAKLGHYRDTVIEVDRFNVQWIADALWDYIESEEADIRKARERLEGTNR